MAEEKIFIIPLRKEWNKVAKYKRAKKAVSAVKSFIARHMKKEDVHVGKGLNELLWSCGSKHPPPKVKVKAIIEENHVLVELVDVPFIFMKKEEDKKSLKEKLLAKKEEKKEEAETPEVRKEPEKERDSEAKKEHEGHAKITLKPEKQVKVEDKQKNMKTEQIVHQSGKKESHAPKP